MKETGIPFRPEMVRAILEGRKTQTRRIAKFPSWVTQVERVGDWFHGNGNHPSGECEHSKCSHIGGLCGDGGPSLFTLTCPYGTVGDHLWVKEGVVTHASIPQIVGYVNDGCKATERWEKQRRAMFMPKWAARIWLEITDVRVQRLQEISEEDAIAEGVAFTKYLNANARFHFKELWNSINGKTHPWESNPWLWCITFKRIKVG